MSIGIFSIPPPKPPTVDNPKIMSISKYPKLLYKVNGNKSSWAQWSSSKWCRYSQLITSRWFYIINIIIKTVLTFNYIFIYNQ